MKFILVRNRGGHAAIHWSSVVLATLAITVIFSVGVSAFSLAIGWFSMTSFMSLPLLFGAIIGTKIKRGLETPVQDLPAVI